MAVPPSRLRGRPRRATYLYDDPADKTRVTGTVEAPEWTTQDRAALLGLAQYESTLCRCGQPKHIAWQINGWYKTKRFVCDACTAMTGEGDDRNDVTYVVTHLDSEFDPSDLEPLRF